MKKMPSIFERDWNGDKNLVTRTPNPLCDWVFRGEGVATVKLDGTCCMVREGRLYKRREIKPGQTTPPDFESCGEDTETGKTVGWVPVGDGPDDQYHREAFDIYGQAWNDGTYELLGPKVQGNPERIMGGRHMLVKHGMLIGDYHTKWVEPARDFDSLSAWLGAHDVEGIVWHHPNGRMAKIKGKDFGHKRGGK